MIVRPKKRSLPRWAGTAGAALAVWVAQASLLFLLLCSRNSAEVAYGAASPLDPPSAMARVAADEAEGTMLRSEAPESRRAEAREAGVAVLPQCLWVTGPSCTLRGEKQSFCIMTAACPAGTRVISGACEGFTSVAIGRSAPSAELSAWSCTATRLFAIPKDNEIAARALCCP